MDQAHTPLAPGTELRARYRIESLVGQGGMGAVYKAQDLLLAGRLCAVKEVMPAPGPAVAPGTHRQVLAQFHREAGVLARLDHPNLPKVSDVFALDQREYLVMDFVAGPNLDEILHQAQRTRPGQGLPETQVLTWSAQLLDALIYLHSQEPAILHRDIKPANIILTGQGVLKLVDFGLVKLMNPDDQQTVTVVQGHGTLAYTPIEQFGGDTGFTHAASDIYSLGATLYHLLAGQAPPSAKARFLEAGQLAELRRPGRRLSRRTEAAIFHAMAMHPRERPASAAEFREMLLGPAPQVAAAVHRPLEPADTWQAALRRHRLLVALALLLLLLALGMSL